MEAKCKITAGILLQTKSASKTTVSVESGAAEKKSFKNDKKSPTLNGLTSTSVASSQYRCALCDVMCPDENALTMHMGGKRHRNRAKQVEEEEKKHSHEL